MAFAYEGQREDTPFSIIRVTPSFTLQLSPFGTKGGEHLAFAMSRVEFDKTLRKIRDLSIGYGDSFDTVGNLRGPGDTEGAKRLCKAVYLFDPNRHLIESHATDS